MKRSALALAAVAAVAAGSPPALAAAAPKTPPPVTKTFYFHGTSQIGNQQQANAGPLMTMDAAKPTGSSDKTFAFFGLLATPNTQCAGNSLFPNWVGNVSGTLKKAKVTFYSNSSPAANAKVQVFADVAAQACNDEYPGPIGEVVVPLKPGAGSSLITVDVPITGPAKLISNLTVQIQPGETNGLPGPQLTTVTYDSSASPSSITFTCQPAKGKKTC